MYDERVSDGKRLHTVQHIAEEFGVTRPTIYRLLERNGSAAGAGRPSVGHTSTITSPSSRPSLELR